jgi:hypothetical protein
MRSKHPVRLSIRLSERDQKAVTPKQMNVGILRNILSDADRFAAFLT